MNYFIDIEPTGANKIVQFGCIREDGKTFYYTSNDKDMVDPDDLFHRFKKYLKEDPHYKEAKFYCWGAMDKNFIINSVREADFKTKVLSGFIITNLYDYCMCFKEKYKLAVTPALEIIAKALDPSMEQTHNALEDSILLKYVFDTERSMNPFDFIYKILVPYGAGIIETLTKKKGKPDGKVL